MSKKTNRILPAAMFLGGVLVYLLAVLPFLIRNKGLFFYYGDYNVQQVPFLIFAHRAVRQGRFFWNPLVDLGGNMGGAFAFYLWGSPFFWLTIPFPESWLPYMMPFLMALKSGIAAAAAFCWIRTQTKSEGAAVLGAFLYAFSGFQACNIVFQHFHDVTAFFPFYLLSFDRFVEKKGRGYGFILMTALMSVINYYFFFGQAVFLILYYWIRWGFRKWRSAGAAAVCREILRILIAGTAGLLLSAFFLVQSIGGILGNARVSEVLNGYDLVAYPDSTTPLAILKSFFMVPDLIARGTLFTSDHIRNGSLAFYLPCFAMAGVFAFWILRRRSWKKTLLTVLLVMAFVPVLCASFSAFNDNFYTRWFYMPVLLCACLTAEVIEEKESSAFTRGSILSMAVTALFILMCFLPVYEEGAWSFTGVCSNRKLLNVQIQGTVFGAFILIVVVLIKRYRAGMLPGGLFGTAEAAERAARNTAESAARNTAESAARNTAESAAQNTAESAAQNIVESAAEHAAEYAAEYAAESGAENGAGGAADAAEDLSGKEQTGSRRGLFWGPACILLTVICCLVSTMCVLHNGSSLISRTGFEKWKLQMLNQRPVLASSDGSGETPSPGDEPFSRVETDSASTNYEMVWGIPTMHCFESTIHPSIFRWYRGIGMIRTVESTLPFERIGARALMSVRYYLENALVHTENNYTDQDGIDGYALINEENGYNVYETENYIPMGISFDSYMTEENYDLLKNGVESDRVLVRSIILSEEMAEKYGNLMEEDTDVDSGVIPYSEFSSYCRERAASACEDFSFDKNGFHALANMEKDNLVLFSIPYDKGFRAEVDGKPAENERADFGLTAVFVPGGRHEIRFTYQPPGLVPAAAVSAVTALLLLLYALVSRRKQ